jgi:hypothetical protein
LTKSVQNDRIGRGEEEVMSDEMSFYEQGKRWVEENGGWEEVCPEQKNAFESFRQCLRGVGHEELMSNLREQYDVEWEYFKEAARLRKIAERN